MTTTAFRRRYGTLRRWTDEHLRHCLPSGLARDLADGCRYVLDGGGKRIRAVLLMLSAEAVGGSARRALPAAAAVEIMHNFTLVHDDIMDNADARRGRPTVHTQWDLNNALLVGDVLLGVAYASLFRTQGSPHREAARIFTEALLHVCDGQGLDLEYERRQEVSVAEYFRMIEMKTGALLAAACTLGGMIGGGTQGQVRALRRFGLCLGRAFQLQDDLLDVLADPRSFGKTIGGDILEGKRTFLLLKAVERARGKDRTLLKCVMRKEGSARTWRLADGTVTPAGRAVVEGVSSIYERSGVLEDARRLVRSNTQKAQESLAQLPATNGRAMLHLLAEELVHRAF